jgi:hypothetical protein
MAGRTSPTGEQPRVQPAQPAQPAQQGRKAGSATNEQPVGSVNEARPAGVQSSQHAEAQHLEAASSSSPAATRQAD